MAAAVSPLANAAEGEVEPKTPGGKNIAQRVSRPAKSYDFDAMSDSELWKLYDSNSEEARANAEKELRRRDAFSAADEAPPIKKGTKKEAQKTAPPDQNSSEAVEGRPVDGAPATPGRTAQQPPSRAVQERREEERRERQAAARENATRAAEALKSGLPSLDAGLELPEEAVQKTAGGRDIPSADGASVAETRALESFQAADGREGAAGAPTADPGDPQTDADLALASVTGFSTAFRDMGLRAGTDAAGRPVLLREDGPRASAAEREALKARIRREPRAKLQYPDFDLILAPVEFRGLQQTYQERPGLRDSDFRHMALTRDERDFRWEKSCSKVSGECNPHAKSVFYNKGEYVAPKDLKSVWDRLPRLGEKEKRIIARNALARKKLSRSIFGSAVSSLRDRLAGWAASLLGDGIEGAAAVPLEAGALAAAPDAAYSVAAAPPRVPAVARPRITRRRAAEVNLKPSAPPALAAVSPAEGAAASWPGWALTASGAGIFIAVWLRRRRKPPAER